MRKIVTILAAAAVPFAIGGALLATAGQASAAPIGLIHVTDQAQADALSGTTITKNVDVPQGSSVKLEWMTINGNVTVEGQLAMNADTVIGNVTVSGGGAAGSASQLSLFNNASHITGNLWVHDSAGGPNGNGSNNGTSFA